MKQKTAWVAGATGLIGGYLIELLSKDSAYDHIVALVRKNSNASWAEHSKVEQWVVDYTQLVNYQHKSTVDDLFCALGSTNSKTPDKALYHQIDVQYPLDFARLGKAHGANFYGLVSAYGANPKAGSFYMKMKGELEQSLQKEPFERIAIARPGILKGERNEFRLAEKIGIQVAKLLPGNYKAIHARDVAAALINAANSQQESVEILPSKTMQGAFSQ